LLILANAIAGLDATDEEGASSIGERDVSLIGVCDGASEVAVVDGGAGVGGGGSRDTA